MKALDGLSLLTEVRTNPSSQAWEHLLLAAISGQIEDLFDRLGSISTLIRSLTDDSSDPATARQMLGVAVERIVDLWQPASPAPFRETERMLRLLATVTQRGGFVKILGQLSQFGRFITTDNAPPGYPSHYLEMLGLNTLALYFPTPTPATESLDAYHAYKRFLYTLSDRAGFRGHACARLLDLELESLSSLTIEAQVQLHPSETIFGVVAMLLNPPHLEMKASITFLHILGEQNEQIKLALLDALRAQRASIDESDPSEPLLILRTGERVKLGDSQTDLEALGESWNEEMAHAPDVVAELVAKEEAGG